MARSTFSGAINSGLAPRVEGGTQIGTASLRQSHTVSVAAGETHDLVFVVPRDAKLVGFRTATVASAVGTSLLITVGPTAGSAAYVASANMAALAVPTNLTILPAAYIALQSPTEATAVHVRLVSVGHAGKVDVQMEYLRFADATQVVAAPQV